MTSDQYLQKILSKYAITFGENSPARNAGNKIYPTVKEWGGDALKEVLFSGSFAKRTAVKGGTDVDLFISFVPTTNETLEEIYESLYTRLSNRKFMPRKQNVSIGITLDGIKIDLIPAKKQDNISDDHSLWKNKQKTWMQTNIKKHINKVVNSGRIDEIKLTKIWRNQHNYDFPSIYLELFVIDALYGKNKNQLATNMFTVLQSLGSDLKSKRIVDPANSNNIISDDIPGITKGMISLRASADTYKKYWSEIIS